jgi:transketolase
MSPNLAPRDVLGKSLVEVGERDPNVVVLDADFCTPGKTAAFKQRFPGRFVQVGIAEQNMMSIAAGLATVGFTPFASTICAFCSRRACDQVMASIALPRLNVKIVGLYAGLFVGKNGATHQSLEDIGIMRSLANMTVVQPVDAVETQRVLHYAARYDGPMYIRIGRDPVPQFVPDNYEFELGRSFTLRQGGDVTLMAYGDLMEYTMAAADRLARQGIQARVINMSSLKPVDTAAIAQAARETRRIVTVDNHNIYGGLGSAVAEVLAEEVPDAKARLKRIGVRDLYGKSGTNEQMVKRFGLRAEDIEQEVLALMKK